MKIRLVVPDFNESSTDRPAACRYCGHWRLHRHGTVYKPARDHQVSQVTLQREKTMRGHTSLDGLQNGIVLTQWLYSGDTAHDLAQIMVE